MNRPRETRDNASLPEYLIGLPDPEWALWRKVLVRSAGFPAQLVLRLASPDWAAAADQLLRDEHRWRQTHAEALAAVDGVLDEIRRTGAWDQIERRKPALQVLKALKKKRLERALDLAGSLEGPTVSASIARAVAAKATLEANRVATQEVYQTALDQQTATLRQIASLDTFREAIVWQNRAAFNTAIDRLARPLSTGAVRDRRQRRSEELAASYLQRYCVKNETIGFFGPSAWGSFVEQGPVVDLSPGPELLAKRQVYLESWGIQQLARHFAEDETLRPWLRPSLMPYARIHGRNLHLPKGTVLHLKQSDAILLAACDGDRPARHIALDLVQDPKCHFESPLAVYARLSELKTSRILAWGFEVPTAPQAWQILSHQVQALDDRKSRRRLLVDLAKLERGRRRIARASGDATALSQAIGRLDDTFQHLTGSPPTRKHGAAYAGRTLVFEDCLRDVDLELGPEIRQAIGQPLSLVLRSARWLISHLAQRIRQGLDQVYSELAQTTASKTIEALDFWPRIEPLLFAANPDILLASKSELFERWRDILPLGAAARRLQLSSQGLRERVAEAFPAHGLGWPAAIHHSPDLMIAADGPEALAKGDYQLVLGEIHIGRNTWNCSGLMLLSPHREEVFRCLDQDLPLPQVWPIPPEDTPEVTTRTSIAYRSAKDILIAPVGGSVTPGPTRTIPISDLVVESSEAGLRIRTRDRQLQFDPIEFFGELLSQRFMSTFDLLADSEHSPRVTIDRLVVRRESWRFAARELEFMTSPHPMHRLMATRRWAQTHNLPRFLFVRTPLERKPIYVDMDSPIFVELLGKAVRRLNVAEIEDPSISVTEMLPSPHQAWLPDAAGRRYMAELRLLVSERSHSFVEPPGNAAEATA